MAQPAQPFAQRVLILSSHPLFGKGLFLLLNQRRRTDVVVVGAVSTIDEAFLTLEQLHPDLLIVDYDDEKVSRNTFLTRLLEGEAQLRVVLLSLKDESSEAIVYDRHVLAASDIDKWLAVGSGLERNMDGSNPNPQP